ncbi:NtaA/DmoA family FMN-dependent monooxygenase [Herbiconiux sp. KACC 21604]|uniref:NtaA/DmoA family FMN-dependent monooxygenase n=1 Tax=unclassified Herbiconiux TaxID=2618217 RepID=UPI001491AEF2|nr:NtaA/DmoA family FMN-dependent monooxygenase [Herbiconiux sp. SALV-R1]QJU53276.1 NtaA/DmoA family FMN-dependent monooxygenase [Herbiconiux sp. SALV-R1]WPO88235.1 NtaA/DmoA family FMN-dependent monooxygenase [Herbiconiux sp. KACC 21604]
MTSPLSFGVFEILTPSNGVPTWRHPHGRGDRYGDPAYWTQLAATLDEAGFDFILFADSYGYPQIDGEVPEEVLTHGILFPGYDPLLLVSAIAQAAPTLGVVVTSSTSLEQPLPTARRFATLDAFTKGHIGWNVVTGSTAQVTEGLFGITHFDHDKRYDVADEFVDLTRSLLEDVWDDDAVVFDRESNVLVDPTRIRPLSYTGEHFASHGLFKVPPGPQRVPVLFQAGMSGRGRDFGARNAEAMFIQGQTAEQAAAASADIRARVVAAGRDAHDLRIISGVTVTVAPTRAEALAKRAELEEQFSMDDAAVLFAGFTGIDLRALDRSMRIEEIGDTDQGHTPLDRYRSVPGIETVQDVLDAFRVQERGFVVTGSPREVAEELVETARIADLDGFLLEPTFGDAGAYEEFIELVVPELRALGAWKEPDRSATLRERLGFPGPHPSFRPSSKNLES